MAKRKNILTILAGHEACHAARDALGHYPTLHDALYSKAMRWGWFTWCIEMSTDPDTATRVSSAMSRIALDFEGDDFDDPFMNDEKLRLALGILEPEIDDLLERFEERSRA